MNLARVDKRVLRFAIDASNPLAVVSEKFHVTNTAAVGIAFKVKTNNPSSYFVRPNIGVIAEGQELDIQIHYKPSRRGVPAAASSKDRFMVLFSDVPHAVMSGYSEVGLPEGYWEEHEKRGDVTKSKFRVEFVDARRETISRADSHLGVRQADSQAIAVPASNPEKYAALSHHDQSAVGASSPPAASSLVHVENRVLRFPVATLEASRIVSTTMKVTNISPVDLAFRVKTTNVRDFIARPNSGVLPNGRTISITISHKLPREPPPVTGLSKDKFLLRIAEAPHAAEAGLPANFWDKDRNLSGVGKIKFPIEYVNDLVRTVQQSNSLPGPLRPELQPLEKPASSAGTVTSSRMDITSEPIQGTVDAFQFAEEDEIA